MSNDRQIYTDERSETVENRSYAIAFRVMGFLLLLDVMYRSVRYREAAWDLMGIVIASGFLASYLQSRAKIVNIQYTRKMATAFVAAGLVAAVIAIAVLFMAR
jgi:tRNA(Phe) wybutosine-synthesizing methylase Tyw3